MSAISRPQLLKEIRNWLIEEALIYTGIAAFVALLVLCVNWASGGITFGEAPVLAFFKLWALSTVGFTILFVAFAILLFCVELVLFTIFAICYLSYKWWQEGRKGSGPGGPPSLRDRNPGEPPHR
jgi:hypothetical protein